MSDDPKNTKDAELARVKTAIEQSLSLADKLGMRGAREFLEVMLVRLRHRKAEIQKPSEEREGEP